VYFFEPARALVGRHVFPAGSIGSRADPRPRAGAWLAIPASLTFAPVDLERQSLADGLTAAGFRADRPAFFQWPGVVPYLTCEAVSATLDFISRVPELEAVFDYADPFENYPAERRESVMATAARAASRGAVA
jgi:O-methyltransferase involved in polyketide biosynthesis